MYCTGAVSLIHSICNSVARAPIFKLVRSLRIDSKAPKTASILAGRTVTLFLFGFSPPRLFKNSSTVYYKIMSFTDTWKHCCHILNTRIRTGSITHLPAIYSKRGKASVWPTERRKQREKGGSYPFTLIIGRSGVREYWMIYKGPGFLAVVCFGSTPIPFPNLFKPSANCPFFSVSCVSPVELTDGGRGWAWSRIIRPQESLALYKSFDTLWAEVEQKIECCLYFCCSIKIYCIFFGDWSYYCSLFHKRIFRIY